MKIVYIKFIATHDEYDPWGEPAYKDVASTYNKHITSNILLAEVLNFIAKLKKLDRSDTDISKILGGNYMRVFSQVWK